MPATFDMDRKSLDAYTGRNPRPEDHGDYWQRALNEMRAVDPKTTCEPADFQVPYARCFDLYFDGVGDSRIHAKMLRPAHQKKPGPALIQFHPYAQGSGDWHSKLAYVAMGFTVVALDVRGQGGQSEDRLSIHGNTLRGHIVRGLDDHPDRLFYRQVFLDTAQLAGIVMDFDWVDEKRVGAMGMSQGGGLTLACAALEPRIALAAPVAPFLSDYLRVWEIDLARDGYAQLQEYFRRFDPLHERHDAVFEKLGYIDIQHLCDRITAKVLLSVGMMDTVCPPSTQFAAYNKITSEKSLLIYPDFAHEIPPGNGDRLMQFFSVLCDPQSASV